MLYSTRYLKAYISSDDYFVELHLIYKDYSTPYYNYKLRI